MRYTKTVNIWAVNPKNLQIGQWVSAGTPDVDRSNCGQFCGITPGGSIVVAWNGNARRCSTGAKDYRQFMVGYARSRTII